MAVENLDPRRPPPEPSAPEKAGQLHSAGPPLLLSAPLTGKPPCSSPLSPSLSTYPFPQELTLASNCSSRRQTPVQKPGLQRLSFWPGPSLFWILSVCFIQEVKFQVTLHGAC